MKNLEEGDFLSVFRVQKKIEHAVNYYFAVCKKTYTTDNYFVVCQTKAHDGRVKSNVHT